MQNSILTDWSFPTAVVAHDAGAANKIISWVKEWNLPCRPYLEGPAKTLWNNALPDHSCYKTLTDALKGVSSIITGTGWSSDLEHEARRQARVREIRTSAVLDHWVNYSQRMRRDNELILPDEFWVTDEWALRIAKREFPGTPVRVLKDCYLEAEVRMISPPPQDGTLLYLLEPIRDTWGGTQQGEFQALDYALESISKIESINIRRILLRPHPSEPIDKYAHYVNFDLNIQLDHSKNLYESINKSDVVIGVQSFALVVASSAGRPVYSSLPPWAPQLDLPPMGILALRDCIG